MTMQVTTVSPRSTFAAVSSNTSKGYTVFDGNQVADLMLRGLRDAGVSDIKGQITYDPTTTQYRIKALLNAPIDIMAHRGVGRVHSAFLAVSGADNGIERFRGSGGIERRRCMNATISQANIEGLNWSRVHKGDVTEIRALIANMPSLLAPMISDLRDVWARASAEYYLDTDGARLSPSEAITRLVYNNLVPHGGKSADQALAYYLQAYAAEDHPASAAGIIMALQRAAHESTWATKWSTVEIEESAGKLLYQNNYTLDAVEA